jgi:hypothetical protein
MKARCYLYSYRQNINLIGAEDTVGSYRIVQTTFSQDPEPQQQNALAHPVLVVKETCCHEVNQKVPHVKALTTCR